MNWNALNSATSWADALEALMQLSAAAIRNRNTSEAARLQALLTEFRENSPPSLNELDLLAYRTGQELSRLQREMALSNLRLLTRELSLQHEKIKQHAQQAHLQGGQLQLLAVQEALQKARVGVEILAGLQTDFQTDDIGLQIEALLKRIQQLYDGLSGQEK